jgi:hypothetical protein
MPGHRPLTKTAARREGRYTMIKRILILTVLAMLAVVPVALADITHNVTISETNATLTATGTVSGLPHHEKFVHIVLSATFVDCSTQNLSSEGDFRVSKGTASFSLAVTGTECSTSSPSWQNVTVTDTTDGVQLYP